jgi:isopentenyldiphosphate isomerase
MRRDPEIEVLDEQGKPTGEALPLSKVHDGELWHRIALAWVYNTQGEVLLQHRTLERDAFPNVWDVSASGHIQAGDSPIATVVRELREELGIQVAPSELSILGEVTDTFPLINGKTHKEHAVVYLVHRDVNLERLEFQTAEVDGARWMGLRDLAADMDKPDTRAGYSLRNPEVYRMALEAIWTLTAPD